MLYRLPIRYFSSLIIFPFILLQTLCSTAQDARAQYPPVLKNSYIGVNIGYINYPFSATQLEPGSTVQTVSVPHTAVRIILFGHQFNKYLSAQISYMRPVNWVAYKNVNGDHSEHTVWMNVAGLTMVSHLPVGKKFSLGAEAGLGIITRRGFTINGVDIVKDAAYATLLAGAGFQYHLNKKWDLQLTTAWSPAHAKVKQPHTLFCAAGFNYYMRSLPAKTVERNTNNGYIFPKQILQFGYTTNALSYGVNNFVSKGAIPIFWGGEAQVRQGFSLNYQRNLFRARKVFSLDWGAGLSYWKSKLKKDKFYTFSLYPVMRFTALRTKPVDVYFNYSVAGPTFISKTIIDEKHTGKKFTFQDFMGMGIFAGKKRKLNAEIRIAHYSNGNIYPQNDGVMIPLSFNFGYSFD
jgi:hypothetical protein